MAIPWQGRASLVWILSAFCFMVVSHLSPYWYMEEPYTHIGLWEKCEWRKPCVWSHENHFYWEIIQPVWWKVCQVLYSLALFTMFVNVILTIEVNVSSHIKNLPKIVNMVFMGCAFIEIIATLGHFGRMANAERGVVIDKEEYRNFGWAFLLGCIAALLQLLALIFFIVYYLKDRKLREKGTDDFNPLMYPPMQPMMAPPHMMQQQQPMQLAPAPRGHNAPPPQHHAPPPQHQQQYQQHQYQQQQYQQQHYQPRQEKHGLNYQ